MPKQYITIAKVRKPTRISLEIYPDCESAPLNPKVPPVLPEQKVLFLWMPKVAGMSISRALSNAYGPRYRALENEHKDFSLDLTSVTFYHSHIPSLVQKGFITQQWVDESFKFAFVRNPWDRLVSLYHWLGLKKELDFDTYINRVVSGNYERPGLTNIRGLYQANRLVDWLRPKGLWLPDYIGKFETLNKDWTNIQRILGIEAPLAHTNQSVHKPYKIYYNIHTQHLVAKRFEEDIDLFKYTF